MKIIYTMMPIYGPKWVPLEKRRKETEDSMKYLVEEILVKQKNLVKASTIISSNAFPFPDEIKPNGLLNLYFLIKPKKIGKDKVGKEIVDPKAIMECNRQISELNLQASKEEESLEKRLEYFFQVADSKKLMRLYEAFYFNYSKAKVDDFLDGSLMKDDINAEYADALKNIKGLCKTCISGEAINQDFAIERYIRKHSVAEDILILNDKRYELYLQEIKIIEEKLKKEDENKKLSKEDRKERSEFTRKIKIEYLKSWKEKNIMGFREICQKAKNPGYCMARLIPVEEIQSTPFVEPKTIEDALADYKMPYQVVEIEGADKSMYYESPQQ